MSKTFEMKPLYWAILILIGWTALLLGPGFVRFDNFGLSEGGALNLLLGWSASAEVESPIIHTGTLDFRLFSNYLLGLYWPGSIIAAKVLSLLLLFLAIFGLYRWSEELAGEESAKLASGLMLLVPGGVMLINNLDTGPYLLLFFVAAWLLDRRYQASPHPISAWYFLQMIVAAACISFHPAGLALALLLAWRWIKARANQPIKSNMMLAGLGFICLAILTTQIGWIDVVWGQSPITALNDALTGYNVLDHEHGFILGSIALILLSVCLYLDRIHWQQDFLCALLALASVIGAVSADLNWALIAISYLLYRGLPLLLQLNRRLGKQSFAGQRGLSLGLVALLCFIFSQSDRSILVANQSDVLSAQDELINTLAQQNVKDKPFFAASQWPARTMMVCKGDVYLLPPAKSDGEKLFESITGVTHIIFDPNQPKNHALAKNLSQINDKLKTLAIQEGGVIIAVREPEAPRSAPAPVAEPDPASDLPK